MHTIVTYVTVVPSNVIINKIATRWPCKKKIAVRSGLSLLCTLIFLSVLFEYLQASEVKGLKVKNNSGWVAG